MVGLVGTFNGNGEVLRLDGGELGQLDTELAQVSTGNFFVKFLWQDVDANGPLARLSPESNLGKNLVGEGVGHDKGRMAGSTAKVDKTTFGQKDNMVAVLHLEAVDLGLDVDTLDGVSLEPGNVNFNVKVTNVADNSIILHDREVLASDNVTAASGGDEDLAFLDSFLHGGDFVTFHSSLKGVDGVNFSDDDTGTEGTESSTVEINC